MYSMAYQVLIMVLPLITAPYLSRVVGAEGTGIYSYTYSIAQYFVYFAMLGISNYGNRSIAKVRENIGQRNYTFSSIYQLQILTSLVAIVIYLLYCFVFVHENRNISLLQGFFVLSAIFDISWLFWGMENFKVTVTRQMLVKICSAICIFLFVKSPLDLWKYTTILSFGVLISQIYLFANVKSYVSFSIVSIKDSLSHFKAVLILFIPIIATSVYRVMDKVMIGALSNMTEVGYYENADKLITTCLGVVGSLGAVMLPKMSNLVANGEIRKQKEYLLKSIEVTMFIAFAISFGIYSIADVFIPFFYGDAFLPSVTITKLLAVSVPFISWANVVRMQYLIPNEKDKIYVSSIVIGAVSNVIINYLLIPRYRANGAAIGTLCAAGLLIEALIGGLLILFSNIILRFVAQKMNVKANNMKFSDYRLKVICDEDKEFVIRTLISQSVNDEYMLLTNMENNDLDEGKVKISATFQIATDKKNQMEELINRIVLEPGVTSSGWKKLEVVKNSDEDDDEIL